MVRLAGWACGACALYMFAQYLGWDFLRWADASRPLGSFANPNFSAATLAAWLGPLLALWAWRRGKNKRLAATAPALALAMAGAVLVSQSRAGLLGLAAGGATLGLLGPGVANGTARQRLVRGAGYALLALGVAWVAAPERLAHLFATDTIDHCSYLGQLMKQNNHEGYSLQL